MATDNTRLLPKFWSLVEDLDGVRNESLVKAVPELEQIAQYKKSNQPSADPAEFIDGYNKVADPSWPQITTVQEFYALPAEIQQEVQETFNIRPPQ
jgi:hypothetical protein